jgi:hypothetical protein
MLATNFDFSNPEDAALRPPVVGPTLARTSSVSSVGTGGADFLPQDFISQLFKQVSLDGPLDMLGASTQEPFIVVRPPPLGRTLSAIACNV